MRARVVLALLVIPLTGRAADSTCYGTPGKGRLEGGVRIAESGRNYGPYSSVGYLLGRTYMHSRIATVVAGAYAALDEAMPGTTFVYGESGWAGGGRIRPHRTHQNGLAVDFMVPVRDAHNRSVPLPAGSANKFGYGLEFDRSGRYGTLAIDFEAVAEHLYALHAGAHANGFGVARVIIAPEFIPNLERTRRGAFIRQSVHFMQGQAWVRHDEHYHVDFALPCKPLPE